MQLPRALIRVALPLICGLFAAGKAAACPGYSECPAIRYPAALRSAPAVAARAAIDATEAAAVQAAEGNGVSFGQLVAYLGEAIAFDLTLSASSTEACAFCHLPAAGFGGGLRRFTRAAGVVPGDMPWRTGPRAPQSLTYAAFAPVLTYRPATRDFAGGNFWDSRATGLVTGSAAADQAMVPLTSPFEMALPDPACAVRRVALAPYAALFAEVWGAQSLAIRWPTETDRVCALANDGGADQTKLHLRPTDRARATLSVQQIALTIETFEATSLASPFSAKFDAVLAGKAAFTPREARGYRLFTGRGHCSACHEASGSRALFTAFASANIGVPRNDALPFLGENVADRRGYVANPAGPAYVDEGLGGFLESDADTNATWRAAAKRFLGAFQVPTLRNVALPGAGRAYMHNGVFSDLRTVVHFLNTRDVLPRCGADQRIGDNCWPVAEEPRNVDRRLTGHLGLSAKEEDDLVAFLGTLSDGFSAQ